MFNKLKMNGAEALAHILVENDIGVVFGIPGVSNLPLFEALRTRASGSFPPPTNRVPHSWHMESGAPPENPASS